MGFVANRISLKERQSLPICQTFYGRFNKIVSIGDFRFCNGIEISKITETKLSNEFENDDEFKP